MMANYNQPYTPNNPRPGFAQAPNRAFLRDVGQQATVRGQLGSLLSKQDDPYLANARRRGEAAAARNGLAFSGAAAAGAEEAALNAAMPIASQDASTYGSAEADNQNALNQAEEGLRQQQIAEETSRAQAQGIAMAQASANAQRERDREEARLEREWRTGERIGSQDYETGARREGRGYQVEDRNLDYGFRREDREDNQGFQSGEAGADRTFRGSESEADRRFTRDENERTRADNRNTRREDYANQNFRDILGTVMVDPSLWRDPAGAAGFTEFFTNLFSGWASRNFGGNAAVQGG